MKRLLLHIVSFLIFAALFFLFYRYYEGESIESSLKMASFIGVFNTLLLYLSQLNWQVKDFRPADKEKLLKILEDLGVEKIRTKKTFVKYKLLNRKWPLNVLRWQESNYIIYLHSNSHTLKKIEHELAKEA